MKGGDAACLEPLPLHDGRPYLLGESFTAADVVVGCELIQARQVGLLRMHLGRSNPTRIGWFSAFVKAGPCETERRR